MAFSWKIPKQLRRRPDGSHKKILRHNQNLVILWGNARRFELRTLTTQTREERLCTPTLRPDCVRVSRKRLGIYSKTGGRLAILAAQGLLSATTVLEAGAPLKSPL
jgi:hypothetical protein